MDDVSPISRPAVNDPAQEPGREAVTASASWRQLDRYMFNIVIDYLSADEELERK